MNILVTDGLAKEGIELLTKEEYTIINEKPEDLADSIRAFDALIVRSATKVTRRVIEAGKDRLKIIGRAGVGYDNIDVEAATEYGIIVKTAPHGNTTATAELALELMLDASRNVPQSYSVLRSNVWGKKGFGGYELTGKILGIIGCGRVGKKLSELVQGFRMEVIGYDPYQQNGEGIKYVPLDDLIAKADYISLHAPVQEKPIISERELRLMKNTAFLVNTSRGENIDEEALYKALSEGWIRGAALDVYKEEGEEGQHYGNRLFELPNFIGTPHLGASTKEAQRKTGIEVAQVVIDYLKKGDFGNAINVGGEVETAEQETYKLFVHHEDIPGAFAKIDDVLSKNNVNIREIRSRKVGQQATAVYILTTEPSEGVMAQVRDLEVVRYVRYNFR